MPMMLRRAFLLFLPLAVAVSGVSGLVYVVGQQALRSGANDPQVQMAEDAAARLDAGEAPVAVISAGPVVDLGRSLAPYLVVYDSSGAPLASDGQLDSKPPAVPKGVLDAARANGVNAVTWQPREGVRMATVSVPWKGGTVTSGRSLRLVEEREDALRQLVGLAWIVTVVATAAACLVASAAWGGRSTGT